MWFLVLILFYAQCTDYVLAPVNPVIRVKNPGENKDIRPFLEEAWERASAGDTILLPAGRFRYSGSILFPAHKKPGIHIKGMGSGPDGTCLYRDYETDQWMIVVYGSANKVSEAAIEISGICFQAMKTRLYQGDTGTGYPDFCGVAFRACDFYLHHCKFQYFSNRAVGVSHLQSHGSGVIADNEFLECLALEEDGKYSKAYGINIGVWGEVDQWVPVSPGSEDFVFIEDNYFYRLAPAVAGSQGALYVFRYNTTERFATEDAHLDLHGARPVQINPEFGYSARFAEVYGNIFHATPPGDFLYEDDPGFAINFKGGEALIFNNTFHGFQREVISLKISDAWHDDYFNHSPEYQIPDYPIPFQIGYESASRYGSSHDGVDPRSAGAGDVFLWDNQYIECGLEVNSTPFVFRGMKYDYVQGGRDYHFSKRPNYKPYTYPHPRRKKFRDAVFWPPNQ
jgi:hypothetical protein